MMRREWLMVGGGLLVGAGAVFAGATLRNGPLLQDRAKLIRPVSPNESQVMRYRLNRRNEERIMEAIGQEILGGGVACALGAGLAVLGIRLPKSPGSKDDDGS